MSTKFGSLSIACVQLGPRKLSVIRSSGVSAIQGLLKYLSEWKYSRDFQNCSLYHGCPRFKGVHEAWFHCMLILLQVPEEVER